MYNIVLHMHSRKQEKEIRKRGRVTMIPSEFVTFNWMIRHFGESINAKSTLCVVDIRKGGRNNAKI